MENGFPVGTDISLVNMFYNLGARYITLCHTRNNDICDSSTDRKGRDHDGLSDFGKEVVKEMNRIGMIIDVSHISDKSFNRKVEVSKQGSHSTVVWNPWINKSKAMDEFGDNDYKTMVCVETTNAFGDFSFK